MMPLTFTLDTNCIVALEKDWQDHRKDEAKAIRALTQAHRLGAADVAVAAISASEKQEDRTYLDNFATFEEWLNKLDIGDLAITFPMMYWDVTFWDASIWLDEEDPLERKIHSVLFPNMPFLFADYCPLVLSEDEQAKRARKWHNAKCDVQALWTHIHSDRQVFVTSDRNFHAATKKQMLIDLGARQIELPDVAAQLLSCSP